MKNPDEMKKYLQDLSSIGTALLNKDPTHDYIYDVLEKAFYAGMEHQKSIERRIKELEQESMASWYDKRH